MNLAEQLARLPMDGVVQVRGARVDVVASAAAEGIEDLAAVVVGPVTGATPSSFVHAILDDLERVAVSLLPGWLPEAAEIDRPDPAGLAAARAAAHAAARTAARTAARAAARTAARAAARTVAGTAAPAAAEARAQQSPHFAPFLSELAIRALTGRHTSPSGFSIETRSLGLARVVAAGLGRPRLVLLIQVPPDLRPADEISMAYGAEWLAHQGRLGIWLLGEPLHETAQVPATYVTPSPLSGPSALSGPNVDAAWAALSGKPHPASATEAALEAALAGQPWAAGRVWNQSYQSHALAAPIRLDLFWPQERCVVELDGPEHCHPVRFEADRQRDVQLQLDGCAVLRFTNARIRHDVGAVVHQIGTYLRGRRRDIAEGRDHGRRG